MCATTKLETKGIAFTFHIYYSRLEVQDYDLISTRNASLASFSYTVTIRVNLFEWKACNVLSGIIISKKVLRLQWAWAGHAKQSFICRLVSQCIMYLGKDCIEPSLQCRRIWGT